MSDNGQSIIPCPNDISPFNCEFTCCMAYSFYDWL